MNSRMLRLFGVFTGLALIGCHSDPLGDLDGTPSTVTLSAVQFIFSPGDSGLLTASILDARGTPLAEQITFTSRDPSVATVTVDNSYAPVPATSVRALVKAVTAGAVTYIVASGGGVSDSMLVGVLPSSFGGAFTASADAGSVLSIASTAVLKFDTSTVNVTFAGGETGRFLSKTPDQLQVLVPFTDPGPLTISGISVTFVPGLEVTLTTPGSFTQTGTDPFPGDSDWPTAPDITSLIPAAGGAKLFLATAPASNPPGVCPEDRLAFGPSGKCSIFKFTLADSTKISFTTDWDGGSGDVDVLICSDSTAASYDNTFTTFHPCELDGLGGASSAQPEKAGGVKYGPGTYWFAAQDYDGGGVKNYYITIKVE